MSRWTTNDIPPQRGRSVVVTGTGGLGFQDALALARAGAEVIIAGRNPSKGAAAVAAIRKEVPNADVCFEVVDLASLSSVAAFGARLRADRTSLDLLINNAAVMTPPRRKVTADGFELQFGTNYLGHFALTAQLLPLLRKGTQPRVVNVSSVAARNGRINFEDLQSSAGYRPLPVYSDSKLASLMFALELQRRSDAAGWGLTSTRRASGHFPHRPCAERRGPVQHIWSCSNVAVVSVSAGRAGRAPHSVRRHVAAGASRRVLRSGQTERNPGIPDGREDSAAGTRCRSRAPALGRLGQADRRVVSDNAAGAEPRELAEEAQSHHDGARRARLYSSGSVVNSSG